MLDEYFVILGFRYSDLENKLPLRTAEQWATQLDMRVMADVEGGPIIGVIYLSQGEVFKYDVFYRGMVTLQQSLPEDIRPLLCIMLLKW
jgi:hypothetical protein